MMMVDHSVPGLGVGTPGSVPRQVTGGKMAHGGVVVMMVEIEATRPQPSHSHHRNVRK